MADDKIKKLAVEQRKRLISGMLNAIEQLPWYSKLLPGEKAQLRQLVFEKAGTYHDFMLDVLKVVDDTSNVNDDVLDLLRQVHNSQQRIEREARAPTKVP